MSGSHGAVALYCCCSPSSPSHLLSESLRRELIGVGITVRLVGRSEEYDYSIVVAQETTLGSAAAAVIALDHNGSFVTSVARSGRMTGKGAFNASAKELAKKIAILRGVR